jgi:hypothetical protein
MAKKNLMEIFTKEENLAEEEKILNKKIIRDEEDEEEEFYLNSKSRAQSFKERVLNSPVGAKNEIKTNNLDNSETKVPLTEKKKYFLCSDHKSSRFDSSSKKLSSYAPTLFSTDKKKMSRCRKSSFQLLVLKQTYEMNHNKDWTKEIITEISSKIDLPESKVYKWLWDRKNKDLLDKRVFFIQSDAHFKENPDTLEKKENTSN